MPIYTYKCLTCGSEEEVKQAITDNPLTECNNCGGNVYRTVGITHFITKGPGFHNNDYPRSH